MDSANRGFVALGSRTRAATIAVACASALCIVTNVLGIAFRDSIETHAINPVTALLFLADVAVFLLAYVVAVVLFSVWLHRAVRNRCAAAVEVLLIGGADPARDNGRGSTPMKLAEMTTGKGGSGSAAAKEQQAEIVRLLTQYGGALPR